MRLGSIILLFALGRVLPDTAPAAPVKVSLIVTTNYYPVHGTNAAELRASKAKNRPWNHKEEFDGETNWKVEWNYRYSGRPGDYRIESFQIKARIDVLMPRWVQPKEATSGVVAGWRKFMVGLGQHELGHVTIAREAVAELQKQLAAFDHFTSDSEMKNTIERTGHATIEKHKAREREYDRRTDHGAIQEARF